MLVFCESSIDAWLESSIRDKGDASDLVLDGELIGEVPDEASLFDLLKQAREDFARLPSVASGEGVVDERDLRHEWPALRDRLREAQALWDGAPMSEQDGKTMATAISEEKPIAFLPDPSAEALVKADPPVPAAPFIPLLPVLVPVTVTSPVPVAPMSASPILHSAIENRQSAIPEPPSCACSAAACPP